MTSLATALDRRALAGLRERFAGELIVPGDPTYEERRRVWNRMIDRRPVLIARPSSTADAREALLFARERGLPVAIRGGGHNVSGSALVDGGVVVDQSLRRSVRVDPNSRRVEVEPGVLLGELDGATRPHGLAVPIGIYTTTGVAGLALGGGIGWLMGAHGLTCDHLVGAEAVVADGRIVTVTEETEPELLWGLRGGGGNFGIFGRFVFQAVPLADPVLAGIVLYPLEEGERVLRRYRGWAAELGRATTTIVVLRTVLPVATMPAELHGRRVVGVAVCHIGPPADDSRIRRALRSLGTVLFDTVERKPFATHQSLFDPSAPAGHGYYWKSHYLTGLSDELIDRTVELHRRPPTAWSYSLIPQLGGAVADVADGASAYPHRSPAFLININGVAPRPADEAIVAWTREAFDALAAYSTGGVYVNFLGDEGPERVAAAYGPAYARLAALKARWDPENVFRVNQNVRPAPAA
ncbi:MAG TPA: FAD-binding oxidoreductase [Candidatus Limnocylindrales bacterium]|nr:FAD-binding oxidoreductase [Candidatus Limnocylindrales bacterium]